MSNFMKMRSVEADLFHADGHRDMMKLNSTFRNFANAPKMRQYLVPERKLSL
jgi:spore cortex formation protein SpoVR/YcgB (stage V sporulation)